MGVQGRGYGSRPLCSPQVSARGSGLLRLPGAGAFSPGSARGVGPESSQHLHNIRDSSSEAVPSSRWNFSAGPHSNTRSSGGRLIAAYWMHVACTLRLDHQKRAVGKGRALTRSLCLILSKNLTRWWCRAREGSCYIVLRDELRRDGKRSLCRVFGPPGCAKSQTRSRGTPPQTTRIFEASRRGSDGLGIGAGVEGADRVGLVADSSPGGLGAPRKSARARAGVAEEMYASHGFL
jgi:hypothetical protein